MENNATRTNTTENVLELLRKMSQTKFDLWQMYKREGRTHEADEYFSAYNTLELVIDLFNTENFYKNMAEVYEEHNEEQEDN